MEPPYLSRLGQRRGRLVLVRRSPAWTFARFLGGAFVLLGTVALVVALVGLAVWVWRGALR